MSRLAAALVVACCSASAAETKLWYTQPAKSWEEALPIGNGRLGGMVFGGIAKERIAFNEDTICNGKKRDCVNPAASVRREGEGAGGPGRADDDGDS